MEQKEEFSEQLLLGIDDAGRGPLIGPMLLAGCLLTKQQEKDLKSQGITDSKLLTPKSRERKVEIIKKTCIGFHTESTNPSEIDTGMGIGLNLNQVEALKASLIIIQLIKPLTQEQKRNLLILIDCPSVNIEAWQKQLEDFLKKEKVDTKLLNIKCKHKADLRYPVVSAASIIAKTERDAQIEQLKKQLCVDFGSGYPADPKTKNFLKTNINNPQIKKARIFRESWSTYQEALKNQSQMELPDY